MQTAVVTGAGGFLGQYIARELGARTWCVVGIDRRSISAIERGVLGFSDFYVMNLPTPDFDSLLSALQPSVIVHAAGPASVPGSVADPAADFHGAVYVFFNVLDAVRRCVPECRVVFLSSAAVYGSSFGLPVREDALPRPISPYGFHKLMCERVIEEFDTFYGVRACSIRIFSAYGPGLRRQVLWDICQKALHQPVVQLLGTGEETRDFIHAQDVAQGVSIIIERGAFCGEVYNLATGIEIRISDLAQMLVAALGRPPKIEFSGTLRVGDPLHWCADITRLSDLGYCPRVSIAEGVADYARWVLKSYEAAIYTRL